MRKRKRNAIKHLEACRQVGVVSQHYRMAKLEPLPKTNGQREVDAIRATQRRRGSSQVPTGWGSMNPHFN